LQRSLSHRSTADGDMAGFFCKRRPRRLATLGYCRCCAMISPGNAASEALFASIGFKEAQPS
jgi:L-amino acid N-acyltransferase YncA